MSQRTAAVPYRQLQPEDRVSIASLRQQNVGIRAIARQSQRSPRTISRELERHGRPAGYDSADARALHRHRRQGARAAPRLQSDSILLGVVCHFLRLHWSPPQIALTLARLYPKGHELRVSHETIHNCIHAMAVGELRKDLLACLRQAHNQRLPRSKGQDRRGQHPEMPSLHLPSSMLSPMGSTAGPARAWAYDLRWLSTGSCSSAVPSIPLSFIDNAGGALQV